MEDVTCCEQPALLEAYAWFWPFRAAYCQCCGETTLLVGRVLEEVWRTFVWPFWDGRVKVIRSPR